MPPKLDLRVQPKLGEREVTFCHVTEWIEKKLEDEFQVKYLLYSVFLTFFCTRINMTMIKLRILLYLHRTF